MIPLILDRDATTIRLPNSELSGAWRDVPPVGLFSSRLDIPRDDAGLITRPGSVGQPIGPDRRSRLVVLEGGEGSGWAGPPEWWESGSHQVDGVPDARDGLLR